MFKKVFQQGRSEREAEAYRGPVAGAPIAVLAMGRDATGERYVEAWSETITRCIARATGPRLEAFFNILLVLTERTLQTGCPRCSEGKRSPG